MKSWRTDLAPKRILGLAMILVGLTCALAQLAKGKSRCDTCLAGEQCHNNGIGRNATH